MTFTQFLNILRARWKLSAAVFFTTVLTAVLLSLVLPKKYTATASVRSEEHTSELQSH